MICIKIKIKIHKIESSIIKRQFIVSFISDSNLHFLFLRPAVVDCLIHFCYLTGLLTAPVMLFQGTIQRMENLKEQRPDQI